MSQKNVELVQAFVRAWNARDMDAVREIPHTADAKETP